MTVKIARRKSILKSQETSIAITTNTILRFKSFTNYENERLESYNYSRIVSEKRTTDVHVKKNDNNKTKL